MFHCDALPLLEVRAAFNAFDLRATAADLNVNCLAGFVLDRDFAPFLADFADCALNFLGKSGTYQRQREYPDRKQPE